MKDLWELTGRFLFEGQLPLSIQNQVNAGIATAPSPHVLNSEIDQTKTQLASLYPHTVYSNFAAGEVVRFAKISSTKGANYFSNAGLPLSPANSTAHFECIGLALIDSAFRLNIRNGGFAPYQNHLTAIEKDALLALVSAKDPAGDFILDGLGNSFQGDVWGGGSCRIAAILYNGYVHSA